MSHYPEHEKVRAIQDQSQAIGEFLEWLGSKGISLATYHTHTDECMGEEPDLFRRGKTVTRPQCGYTETMLQPEYKGVNAWLAEYFGIDQDKLEAEKREILEELRRAVPA